MIVDASAVLWMHKNNVEEVRCWLPTFDQVCDGTHTVTALGNDGMAVNIIVDTDMAMKVMGSDFVQLVWLGKYLMQFRAEEVMAGQRSEI